MTIGLTAKQDELLRFIESELDAGRVAPSFDEMAARLGLKAKSGVHRLISGLEERGLIRRLPSRARAIEIVSRSVLPNLSDEALITALQSRGYRVEQVTA